MQYICLLLHTELVLLMTAEDCRPFNDRPLQSLAQ